MTEVPERSPATMSVALRRTMDEFVGENVIDAVEHVRGSDTLSEVQTMSPPQKTKNKKKGH